MPHRLHLEKFSNIHALPVLHYRLEFACLVRQAVERLRPHCIAIELPATLEVPFLLGVRRLPEVSVLSYDVKPVKGESRTISLLIEPADPLVEGARLALTNNIPLALVDVDLDDYPCHEEAVPDSYAVQRIGLKSYYDEFVRATAHVPPCRGDRRREQGMAWRLQQLSAKHERVLFLCGMAHLERIKELFARSQTAPLERVRRDNVRLMNLHPDSCREVLGEFPFLSAVYELRRSPLPPEPVPVGEGLRKSYSAFELISGGKKQVSEEEILKESVLRSAHHVGDDASIDRQRLQLRLFQEAARHYRQESGEPVHIWQKRAFFKYARNYALTAGYLLPDLFQLLATARACVDDNFAFAFWRLATFYPWQQ
jgi:hypothetical protein